MTGRSLSGYSYGVRARHYGAEPKKDKVIVALTLRLPGTISAPRANGVCRAIFPGANFMYDNFSRLHQTLRVAPATAAGVTGSGFGRGIVSLVKQQEHPSKAAKAEQQ